MSGGRARPCSGAAAGRRVLLPLALWILAASGCVGETELSPALESAAASTVAAAPVGIATRTTLADLDRSATGVIVGTTPLRDPASWPIVDPRDVADESRYKELIRPGPAVERRQPFEESVSNEAAARGVVLPDGTRSRRSAQRFLAVEAGGDHTCAIALDGTLACWGDNSRNQLEVPSGEFTQLSAGTDHTCAVDIEHAAVCWGSNTYGRAEAPTAEFLAVSAADDYTCALRVNGTIECWGWDVLDRLDPPLGAFVALESDSLTSCGLRRDGSVECWGANWWGLDEAPPGPFVQIGVADTHACGLRAGGEIECWGLEECSESDKTWEGVDPQSSYHPKWTGHVVMACSAGESPSDHGQAAPPRGEFASVSVARWYSCGVRADGSAECWGDSRYQAARDAAGTWTESRNGIEYFCHHGLVRDGCSRDGDYSQTDVPPGNYLRISIGDGHSCGLHVDGTLECWGDNLFGEIDIPEAAVPARNGEESGEPSVPYVDVSVSGGHGCGLRADGRIRCWGVNDHGQLDAPDEVFMSVTTGPGFTCGLWVDGTPRCWGLNDNNQTEPLPGQYVKLSAADGYACGLLRGGIIECWGDNWANQANAPFGIFDEVSAGGLHSCGLRYDGTVECWGGEGINSAIYAAFAPNGTFRAIDTAYRQSCGIRTDDSVSCWGWNSPVYDYEPDRPFVEISAGSRFVCGLHADGTVSCLGENDYWQTDAPGGTFSAISSRGAHSCAVRTEGTVACWGANSVGQSDGP